MHELNVLSLHQTTSRNTTYTSLEYKYYEALASTYMMATAAKMSQKSEFVLLQTLLLLFYLV